MIWTLSMLLISTEALCGGGVNVRLSFQEEHSPGVLKCYYETTKEVFLYWGVRMCPLSVTVDMRGNLCKAE